MNGFYLEKIKGFLKILRNNIKAKFENKILERFSI